MKLKQIANNMTVISLEDSEDTQVLAQCNNCKEKVYEDQEYRNYDSELENYYHYECTHNASK